MRDHSLAEPQSDRNRAVAIVVNTYDQAHFLADALNSCLQQTVRPSEILLIDDGSHDNPEKVAMSLVGIRIYRQGNAGLAAARNAGLARISSEFVIFLDADDRLTPLAIEAGLECYYRNPDAWLVYGAHRIIDAAGRPASSVIHIALGPEPFLELLRRGNLIMMHGTVMYRTDSLRSVGGFDQTLRACEDYDIYLRIARRGRIATHDCCVAEYRHHKGSLSQDKSMMLEIACSVVRDRAAEAHSKRAEIAAQIGQEQWTRLYEPEIFIAATKILMKNPASREAATTMLRAARSAPLALLQSLPTRLAKAIVRRLPRWLGQLFGEHLWVPKAGTIHFGDFGRTRPISLEHGFDRGTPIDRHYIERALQGHSALIRGRVLEIAGRKYAAQFGGNKVERIDVLDINADNPEATLVGDLGVIGSLPKGGFDCIILTQTLQFVHNLDNAIANLFCALAPGGALLISVPGISPIVRHELNSWRWTFTELSLSSLLSSHFGENNVQTQSYGNVFAAICFLSGLSLTEIEPEKLDYHDKSYPVVVFACASKLKLD